MRKNLFKTVVFVLMVLFVFGCGGDWEDSTEETTSTGVNTGAGQTTDTSYNVNGEVQKGPFAVGAAITIYGLDSSLNPTGTVYSSNIRDNVGTFQVNNVAERYVEVVAFGFYFDEVAGQLSDSNLRLRALADLQESTTVNVNPLTTLEYDRVKYLMLGGDTFPIARAQAEQEIAMAFDVSGDTLALLNPFNSMNISQSGTSNAVLLAISAVLQSGNSVAELSELIAKINLDIEYDGVIDDPSLVTEIQNNASKIVWPRVQRNLQNRYTEIGVGSVTILPEFVRYVKNLNAADVNITDVSGDASEAGGVASFAVSIGPKQTMYDVYFDLTVSDTTEADVSPDRLVFTPENAHIPQAVSVIGLEDDSLDGDVSFDVIVSDASTDDADYNGRYSKSVTFRNIDNEGVGAQWRDTSSLPEDYIISSAAVVNNQYYAIMASDSINYSTDVLRYDISTDSWAQVASIPETHGEKSTSSVIDGKIYTIGGHANLRDLSTVHVYDTSTDNWSAKADIPVSISGHASVAHGTKIYLIGGRTPTESRSTKIFSYDTSGDVWTEVATMPFGRYGASAEVIGEKIYIFGGKNQFATTTNRAEVLDTSGDVLTGFLVDEGECNAPYSLYQSGSAVINDVIYFYGGQDRYGYSKSVYSFSPVGVTTFDDWLASWNQLTDMPTRMMSIDPGVVMKEGIERVIFGGPENYLTDEVIQHVPSWEP